MGSTVSRTGALNGRKEKKLADSRQAGKVGRQAGRQAGVQECRRAGVGAVGQAGRQVGGQGAGGKVSRWADG